MRYFGHVRLMKGLRLRFDYENAELFHEEMSEHPLFASLRGVCGTLCACSKKMYQRYMVINTLRDLNDGRRIGKFYSFDYNG